MQLLVRISKKQTLFKNAIRPFCILLFLVLLGGCQSPDPKAKGSDNAVSGSESILTQVAMDKGALPAGPRVSVMTFNVENLFDTENDPTKNDETYLPLAYKKDPKNRKEMERVCRQMQSPRWVEECFELNWDESVLKVKKAHLARAILQVNNGKGPDILALDEVENLSVLKSFVENELKAAGYQEIILLEGQDLRGIDTAILSRLKQTTAPQLLPMRFRTADKKAQQDTRGALVVTLGLPDGTPLHLLAVHFPAPFHPTAMRVEALRQLNDYRATLPAEALVIALGDMNITAEEEREKGLLQAQKGTWEVSHFIGCKECQGTNYFPPKRSWSFLDVILFSSSFERPQSPWGIDKATIQLANKAPEQVGAFPGPKRFDPVKKSGTSDHWPLYVELIKRNITIEEH